VKSQVNQTDDDDDGDDDDDDDSGKSVNRASTWEHIYHCCDKCRMGPPLAMRTEWFTSQLSHDDDDGDQSGKRAST